LAVDNWISELHQQFNYYSLGGILTTDAQRIQYAVANFSGVAHQWWESQEDRNTLDSWTTFVERLHSRFRPINAPQLARQRLDKLRMRDNTSVNTYISQFHTITMPIVNMGEDDRIHTFIRGLTQKLATKVLERNPTSLKEAIDYAVMAEATGYYAIRGTYSNGNTGFRSSAPNMGNAPMDVNNLALEEAMFEEHNHADSSSSSSAPTMDLQAMVQAAVLNAMSSFKGNNQGGRSFANGKKDHIPGLKKEDIAKLMREDRCFRCKGIGHRKDDPACPKKPKNE
jgi:hypothetical protein